MRLLANAVMFLLVAACIGAVKKASVRIELHREADMALITAGNDLVVIAVTSPSGIGRGVIRRNGEKWPERITLKLMNFRTLEGFNASNAGIRVHTFLNAEKPELHAVGPDGKLTEIPFDPAYTTPIEKRDDGILINLPTALFPEDTQEVRIEWVDAYRV